MNLAGSIRLNKRGYSLLAFLVLLFIYFHYHSTPSSSSQLSLLDLLRTSILAAEEGGKLVVSQKNDLKIESKGKTVEGMEDSVTTADFLSHCAMKTVIRKQFPGVFFVSEEEKTKCVEENRQYELSHAEIDFPNVLVNEEDVTIWIDPLDATHEYTEHFYEYVTTMVCVSIKGTPVIGVIHNPFDKTTYWAVVGHLHSENLKKTSQNSSDKIRVTISKSHSGSIKEVLNKNFKNAEVIVAAGSGYKALKVVKGEADAYLHITAIKKWDICAGNAILTALGGKMTDKFGKSLTYFHNDSFVNEHGLIASMDKHQLFVGKL